MTRKTIRYRTASRVLEDGRTFSNIHKDVRTTMICTHVLNRGGRGVKSPVANR